MPVRLYEPHESLISRVYALLIFLSGDMLEVELCSYNNVRWQNRLPFRG